MDILRLDLGLNDMEEAFLSKNKEGIKICVNGCNTQDHVGHVQMCIRDRLDVHAVQDAADEFGLGEVEFFAGVCDPQFFLCGQDVYKRQAYVFLPQRYRGY